ncbi:MAG: hypothetical protein E7642_09075 [Ruminococcaceae bacterium]|nr:hypothetical protein [Oscillospiraceae bacterium]
MKKNSKTKTNASKPVIIAAIGAGVAAIAVAFGKAFKDMKANAKAQHEVDKANFEAVKAESRANFEENRGRNTFRKAKADAKKSWDDAHMSPSERAAHEQAKRDEQIALANERRTAAEERIDTAKN